MREPKGLPRIPDVFYLYDIGIWGEAQPLTADERTVLADSLKLFNRSRYRLAAYVIFEDKAEVLLGAMWSHDLDSNLNACVALAARDIAALRRASEFRMGAGRTSILVGSAGLRAGFQFMLADLAQRHPGIQEYQWLEVFNVN